MKQLSQVELDEFDAWLKKLFKKYKKDIINDANFRSTLLAYIVQRTWAFFGSYVDFLFVFDILKDSIKKRAKEVQMNIPEDPDKLRYIG